MQLSTGGKHSPSSGGTREHSSRYHYSAYDRYAEAGFLPAEEVMNCSGVYYTWLRVERGGHMPETTANPWKRGPSHR